MTGSTTLPATLGRQVAPATMTGFTRLAAACRLEPAWAERVRRTLMESLACPGVPKLLEVPAGLPPVLAPLVALCSLNTSVSVVGPEPDRDKWEAFAVAVTGARRAAVTTAGWVAALGSRHAAETLAAFPGTPEAPELAARLFLSVDRIHAWDTGPKPTAHSTRVQISGPGVRGIAQVSVDGLDPELMLGLDRLNGVYPAGLDAWLVDAAGRIIGLPRRLRITATTG